MPLYSELYHNFIGNTPVIPVPIVPSIPSSSYLPPSYTGVSRAFGTPITATRTPSFSRGYVPKLTPITETPLTASRVTALTRINSTKYIPSHASPTYQKARRVINTADIDVSASRYAIRDHTPIRDRYPSSSPSSSVSSDNSPLSAANISVREQELIERNEQRKARSTINRNRAVVRLNTIRARSKSRGSRGSTERKSPRRTESPDRTFEDEPQSRPTSWRDQFRGELSLQPKKTEPIKSPGELLLEKHLIREDECTPVQIDETVYKSPVMKRRATVRRKSGVKIPSFHEICSDINSDKLDDDLNAGELRRRASQIIEDEIAQFQEELHKANGIMNDQLEERLKTALEQQITEASVEPGEKKKLKKVRRVRSKPLPKIDSDNNVVHDQPESGGITTKAVIESIEESSVFKLPKKKKKSPPGDSSPESGERPVKKMVKKVVGENKSETSPKEVEATIVDEPAESKQAGKSLVLGELAQRRKAQELAKKIETLSKLSSKKLPAESLESAGQAEKAKPEATETTKLLELSVNEKLEPLQAKQSASKKDEKCGSKPTEVNKSISEPIKQTEVKVLQSKANEPPGDETPTKSLIKAVVKPKKVQETVPNLKEKNAVLNDGKTDLKIETLLSDLTQSKAAVINTTKVTAEVLVPPEEKKLSQQKTNKEVSCETKEPVQADDATKRIPLKVKPKSILKTIATEEVKGVEPKVSEDSQKPTLLVKPLADEPKSITKSVVPDIKSEPLKLSILEKKIELAKPTEQVSAPVESKTVDKGLIADNKSIATESAVMEKVPKDLQSEKNQTKLSPESNKVDAESSPQKQPSHVEATAPHHETSKPESPKSKIPDPPKPPPKPIEPSLKPKPILKPALRKKPADLKLPSQDEVDFWGNIGTRETISFARRKQNIERRNHMILLKFSETEEDSESAPIASPISKTVTTKQMVSPPAGETPAARMPQWPKPAVEEDGPSTAKMELQAPKEILNEGIPKKAFEVSLVKLDQEPPASPKLKLNATGLKQKLDSPVAVSKTIESQKSATDPGPVTKNVVDTELPTSPKEKKLTNQLFEKNKPLTIEPKPKEPVKSIESQKAAAESPVTKNVVGAELPTSPKEKRIPNQLLEKNKPLTIEPTPKEPVKTVESQKPAAHPSPINKNIFDTDPPTSPKEKKLQNQLLEKNKPLTIEPTPKEPAKTAIDNGLAKVAGSTEQSPKPTRNIFGLKKVQKSEEGSNELPVGIKKLSATPTSDPTAAELSLLKNPVQTGLLKPSEIAAKRLLNPQLSPKEMIKAVAPNIAAAAEKKLAQASPPETVKDLKQEKTREEKQKTPKPSTTEPPTTGKQEKTSEGKQEAVQKTAPEPIAVNESAKTTPTAPAPAGGEKKTKVVKKVIRVVKSKPSAPDAAAKAEADRLEAERRKAQENVEKMKAKVNQITLNMGVKLEVEIKECAKCQQATLSGELPVSEQQPNGKKKPADKAAPKADGGKLAKNKFGVTTNLSNLLTAAAGDRSVSDQVLSNQVTGKKAPAKARYSSSSSEEDERTASETSFSGVEDDWSSDEEEEMANDKPEKKKFDPQKRVKLNFEQMRKCYSKEEKSPIVLVARPRPLWKVKRHGHRHNRKADLTSSSSGSEDESGSTTDQTSSEATSTVDASSDVNTDSSVNSSRGNNKKKQVKSTSKTSDVGSDIYDNPMVIPLHSEPPSSSSSHSKCPAKDENNNERSQSQQAPNEDDDENNKNVGNHEIRSTSTSSHDSGFYGGGTAPISPKKAMETSYTYAQFQKTGKLTAPATVIPRFRKYNVDDFHFLTVLGKGSFGKVFLAELRNTEYYYAVKCLKKDVVLEDDDVDCTLIERKVLALGTKHPFLCHLFCTFQTDSHLFFVMEYLNGGDLMFHIQQSGRFTEARARFYAAEIVSGLKFLHRKGIVYRDLKLDNVLLDYDGHVRIADFGMCKLEIYLDRLADSFCGTPDYMAPEIIKGQKYNQAVDWWSFGVLVYEMLVGQSPFSGCDEDELFWSICNEIPWFPHFLSKEALKLLKSLLEKDATIRLGCLNTMDEDSDIKYHQFFESIDWQKLERRGLEPPFKPQVRHPLDTQYFDKQFTRERARLTPIDRNILASMNQAQFEGFTYTNPNNTLTTAEVTYHPIRCRIERNPRRFYL
ncbi:titin isoform X2 [Wyeomyia smithii]|uniref:titin isoform X2 n=1 Tax=Wyeomyia smithii TaxID=174621 RepID=UPI0024680B35|nr:titin isoform X2 [Wyeomyia smithii]